MTALATLRTPRKRYLPRVRIVDRRAGLYTVQSRTYSHILYLCDVVNRTCECEAGQHNFVNCAKRPYGVCTHLGACILVHEALSPKPAPAEVPDFAALASEFAALPVVTFDFRTQRADLVETHGKAAGLHEAFGA